MAEKTVRGSPGTTGRRQSTTRRKRRLQQHPIYRPGFITFLLDLLPKVFVEVRTGPLSLLTRFLPPIPAHTPIIHTPEPYQSRGCWPGYRPSQSAEWWAWEMGCCSNPRRDKERGAGLMPLIPSAQGEKQDVRSAAFTQRASEPAGAGKDSRLLLHTLSPSPGHRQSQARSTGVPTGRQVIRRNMLSHR